MCWSSYLETPLTPLCNLPILIHLKIRRRHLHALWLDPCGKSPMLFLQVDGFATKAYAFHVFLVELSKKRKEKSQNINSKGLPMWANTLRWAWKKINAFHTLCCTCKELRWNGSSLKSFWTSKISLTEGWTPLASLDRIKFMAARSFSSWTLEILCCMERKFGLK